METSTYSDRDRRHHGSSSWSTQRLLLYGVPLGALAISLAAGASRRSAEIASRPADSAPGRAARRWRRFGDYAVVGRTVTINRPRAELYAAWRDFANLPKFMETVEEVRTEDGTRAVWKLAGPAGRSYRVETDVISERENEQIGWRSVEGSEIDTEGKVTFRDAPGGRGTEVEAIIAYKPPGGAAGRLLATVLQEEPAIQARRDLKRFKMFMETGEIATSANRRPSA